MLGCEEALELISARLDGELTAAEQAGLDAHLASCPECRALQADFQKLHASLTEAAAAWRAQPPAGLTQDVLEAVRAAKLTPFQAQRRRWRRRSWASLAAVLALVFLGGGALFTLRGGVRGGNGAAAPPAALAEPAAGASDTGTGEGVSAADSYVLQSVEATAPEEVPPSNATSASEDNTVVPYLRSARFGAEEALSVVYGALGGSAYWTTAQPLPTEELTGLLLASTDGGESVYASLVCVDESADAYLLHCHAYADESYAPEGRAADYEEYVVSRDEGLVSSAAVDGEAGGGVSDALLLEYSLERPESDPCGGILLQ